MRSAGNSAVVGEVLARQVGVNGQLLAVDVDWDLGCMAGKLVVACCCVEAQLIGLGFPVLPTTTCGLSLQECAITRLGLGHCGTYHFARHCCLAPMCLASTSPVPADPSVLVNPQVSPVEP